MALNLPNSPTNGQIFSSGTKKWTWSTAEGSWLASNYAPSPENVNGIVKCNGAGNFSAAAAGTDYLTSATLGSSPATAKAWVNFNGTTSPGTIRDSYNVSSVTYNGAGDYTLNFPAGVFANENYAFAGCCETSDNSIGLISSELNTTFTVTQTSLRFVTWGSGSSTSAKARISMIVFGN
jgi:hypothetical protein